MAQIIAFVSPKGGCGSTFVCAGLWCKLADMGSKVLALDLCFDKCTLDFAMGFQSDYVYTLSDVIAGVCEWSEAIVHDSVYPNAGFLRADYEHDGMDFPKAASLIKSSDYDYVLIDFQADAQTAEGVLAFADKLVCVTEPALPAVKLCENLVNKFNFENSLILVNKIIPSYIKAGIHLTIDEIMDITACPLLGIIPWSPEADIIMKQGISKGMDDTGFDIVFANIASRIKGERIPASDINKVYDCFKLSRKFALKSD